MVFFVARRQELHRGTLRKIVLNSALVLTQTAVFQGKNIRVTHKGKALQTLFEDKPHIRHRPTRTISLKPCSRFLSLTIC